MNSTATLTSLAILKVYVDQEEDYLEYLRPFILQVLVDRRPDPVTNVVVCDLILEQFGLVIPGQTVEIVLKRISLNHAIERKNHVYRITGDLPDPQITAKMSEAKRHIDSVVTGLQQFSQDGVKPISSPEQAVTVICAFLAKFDVTCLRAYLRGTVIPLLMGDHETDIVQVSEYVQHVQLTAPERFESFLILVQGHMLANALLCPDLENASLSYCEVMFYLDTPLLIPVLGLEGESRQSALLELIALLSKLGGKVAVFAHTCRELHGVLNGAAKFLDSPEGRGSIVYEAKERGTTKSDLLLLAESIDEKLGELGIEVEDTPRYINAFQIDEIVFEEVLKDEVRYYYNPKAILYDINSVRSIYAIRGDKFASSLEKAQAVFVTSNNAFAKAAWKFGQGRDSSRDVSVVISDFSLANMAWLKAPMEAPKIPRTQLLAFSYAALKPSSKLLDKFMTEIDRLECQGRITERQHQLLRSSDLVRRELVHLTLGEDTALTGETVIQTLDRVVTEIRKEDSAKIDEVEEAHKKTQTLLSSQVAEKKNILENIHRRCQRNAKLIAWIVTCFIATIFVAGIYSEIGISSPLPTEGRILFVGSAVYVLISAGNLFFNFNFLVFHKKLQEQLLKWFLLREAKTIGVDLSEFNRD